MNRSEEARSQASSGVPAWFIDEVIALFALYRPDAPSRAVPIAWWRYLAVRHKLSIEAIRKAMLDAPQAAGTQWVPSAELVRQLAEAIERTPKAQHADMSRRALTEPEQELSPDNPFYKKIEAFKRGEIPGKQAAEEIVAEVAMRRKANA